MAENLNFDNDTPYEDVCVRLAKDIKISDVASSKGAVFEIAEEAEHSESPSQERNYFYDENLLDCLTLGTQDIQENDAVESDEDLEPFDRMARTMEDISGDSGVLKMIVKPGTGDDIPPKSFVSFHYNAFLEYGDEPFDSTYLRNKEQRATLGSGNVIPGLDIALQTMRKNETARFLIKPNYAFGNLGCPPRIPGECTLLYEVTMKNFVDRAAADTFDGLTEEERQMATFDEKLEAARAYHRKGNSYYHYGNLGRAKDAYRRAAWIMEASMLKNEEEEKKRASILIKMYSNMAQVYLDLKEPARACTQCKLALEVPGNENRDLEAKVWFRYGKAKAMFREFPTALKYFKKAQKLRPYNLDIASEIESLIVQEEKCLAQEKAMCQQMFNLTCNKQNKSTPESSRIGGEVDRGPATEGKISQKNHNSVFQNVSSEFRNIVGQRIQAFCLDERIKEMPFPPNLSTEELGFIAAEAKAAHCDVGVVPTQTSTILKIVKR